MNSKKKFKSQKEALKEPLGTFYHPTKNTYRTGACEIGEILKKGYTKKVGNKNIYIEPQCIKNKGKPGITINHKSKNKIKENNKMEKYINQIHKSSYKSVILKLKAQTRKKDISNSELENLKKDIELLEKWRKNNPNIGTKRIKNIQEKNINKQNNINNLSTVKKKNNNQSEYLFNSSIKEFHKNLNVDFLPTNKNNDKQLNKNLKSNNNLKNKSIKKKTPSNSLHKLNKIKELSNKEILDLIKDN